ncbi:DNA-binding transcriptional regulator, LysR family [Pseudoxanthobacter soli DSM 19599]|uniref:DNA-binding transcriptional regulator, LysR family n=1 Tax=Pseudoxanthobacter soli DSM 19599 TaxID=1123029 RepID=A0A1M7Z9L8_9HYPH|nr:LysR substrate-binding domain-containing protein [Pseudoxanthobacter soli]SHO61611.1 DNA-binding transcriptional regulator, LysR family [Pseudoxanthobacter soli DSM 19599]
MLDLDLLRSFVSVADTGGFTRAGERVHRTQSTVSQQIKRLEDDLGRQLFLRDGRTVQLTEEGERLLGYARRILELAGEARAALASDPPPPVVRLGIPDDFSITPLTETVAAFARSRPDCRLEVRCGLSVQLTAALERGELDVALIKRKPGAGTAFAAWPEHLVWIASRLHDAPATLDPVPLVAFPQGCIYRDRMIRALEAAGRRWTVAYESPNLLGIQAAIAGGLGVALLDRRVLTSDHRVLDGRDGFPPVEPAELALMIAPGAGQPAMRLAETLAGFCGSAIPAAA